MAEMAESSFTDYGQPLNTHYQLATHCYILCKYSYIELTTIEVHGLYSAECPSF